MVRPRLECPCPMVIDDDGERSAQSAHERVTLLLIESGQVDTRRNSRLRIDTKQVCAANEAEFRAVEKQRIHGPVIGYGHLYVISPAFLVVHRTDFQWRPRPLS